MFDFVTVVGSIVDALMVEFAVSNLGCILQTVRNYYILKCMDIMY